VTPNRFLSVLIAVLSAASTAVLAQPTAVSPVTVQAAPTPKAIEKQTRTFVQSYAAASNPEVDQIGRWHDPVCVQVEGLSAPQAAVIKARIESVAHAVGLLAARAGCIANVEIVFSDTPQAVMDAIAKRSDGLLGYHDRLDTNRVKTVTHPIQAWYKTATRGEGPNAGLAFANMKDAFKVDQPNVGYPGATTDREVIDSPANVNPTGCADAPRFSACLKSLFKNVFIVADSKAMDGRDLGLVADHMVMLALSKPRSLDGCNALPSVIDGLAKSACSGRDPPDGLTPADAAYLTALYASDAEGKIAGEQGDIAGRMANILIKASAASTGLPPANARGR
jgi:hypothetical protein